jgi:hypothetical protein
VTLTSRSAIREVAPRDVVTAVEAYLDAAGLARHDSTSREPGSTIMVARERGGWTTLTWPAYFAPSDLAACRALSRDLHTVVCAVTTTDAEGWSHTLFACGTELDTFHSYPAALAWDDEDPTLLARQQAGDFELVARVVGVDACGLRRHFCQATDDARDHPGRESNGYLGLWAALGIRPAADEAPYAVLEVDSSWARVTAR